MTRRTLWGLLLALLFIASPALGQDVPPPPVQPGDTHTVVKPPAIKVGEVKIRTVSELPATCAAYEELFVVKDGDGDSDCATGTGSTVQMCGCDSDGISIISLGGGGAGSPAAPLSSVQWNDGGVFGGATAFTFGGTGDDTLTINSGGEIFAGAGATVAASGGTVRANALDANALDALTEIADLCAANQVIARNAGDTAWECAAAGSGTPGGLDTELQWNNAGAFDGADQWTFGGTGDDTLFVGGSGSMVWASGSLITFSSGASLLPLAGSSVEANALSADTLNAVNELHTSVKTSTDLNTDVAMASETLVVDRCARWVAGSGGYVLDDDATDCGYEPIVASGLGNGVDDCAAEIAVAAGQLCQDDDDIPKTHWVSTAAGANWVEIMKTADGITAHGDLTDLDSINNSHPDLYAHWATSGTANPNGEGGDTPVACAATTGTLEVQHYLKTDTMEAFVCHPDFQGGYWFGISNSRPLVFGPANNISTGNCWSWPSGSAIPVSCGNNSRWIITKPTFITGISVAWQNSGPSGSFECDITIRTVDEGAAAVDRATITTGHSTFTPELDAVGDTIHKGIDAVFLDVPSTSGSMSYFEVVYADGAGAGTCADSGNVQDFHITVYGGN